MSDDETGTTGPAEQIPVTTKPWRPDKLTLAILGAMTVVAGLAGGAIAIWLTSNLLGPVEWGPVAAWVGSAATFVAVVVALYQTKVAQATAEQARKDRDGQSAKDEARHALELESANKRLTHELTANRRLEQLKTIPPIWEALPSLTLPTNAIVGFMKSHNEDKSVRSRAGVPQSEATLIDYERLNSNWMVDYENVSSIFTPAEILIDDEYLARVVATCHHRLQTLKDHLVESMKSFSRDELLDHDRVRELMKLINETKTPMLGVARRRLSDISSPIMAFPEHSGPEHMMIIPPEPSAKKA
ncbi:hypothetical protein HQO82_19300 [Rhodococcus fascians]|nr:hypothetical protein [Rhodococcus fascians]MBY4115977.1 hypothetical protein [Rhodococcus fascians]